LLFLEWKGKGIITDGRWNRVHPVWLVDVTHSLLPPHFVQSEQAVESEDKSLVGGAGRLDKIQFF